MLRVYFAIDQVICSVIDYYFLPFACMLIQDCITSFLFLTQSKNHQELRPGQRGAHRGGMEATMGKREGEGNYILAFRETQKPEKLSKNSNFESALT